MGNSWINGGFSMAMFDYWRVSESLEGSLNLSKSIDYNGLIIP